MQVIYERCAAVDVGKGRVAVAVRKPGDGPGGSPSGAHTDVLRGAARGRAVAHGRRRHARGDGGDRIYSMPVYHALIEYGDFEKVLVCNAGHVKNVPGRKTDLADAEWLRSCWSAGCCRQLHPAGRGQGGPGRDPLPAKIAQQRVSEISRLGNVLQERGHQA